MGAIFKTVTVPIHNLHVLAFKIYFYTILQGLLVAEQTFSH